MNWNWDSVIAWLSMGIIIGIFFAIVISLIWSFF